MEEKKRVQIGAIIGIGIILLIAIIFFGIYQKNKSSMMGRMNLNVEQPR